MVGTTLNKAFYNTILAQAFSPCGNYLVVGDIYGVISIFHLSKIVHSETNLSPEELTPKGTFVVKEDYQVNSLLTTESSLIVGGVGTIYAYSWKALKNSKTAHWVWTIDLPNSQDTFDKTDVNCLLYNEENHRLYAGCGNNKIYVYDIETRKLLNTLDKHSDYIHALSKFGKDLVSASEDGLVHIWDEKTMKVTNTIEPSADDKIARPDIGKWIGAVSCNEDYILCGGGPRLSLWHLRFLTNSTIFPIQDKGIHVAEIHQDKILSGGNSRLFYQMSFNGDMVSEIQTSAVTTYSAVYQDEPFKVLSIVGSSPKIDICTNYMYKDQQLFLYY